MRLTLAVAAQALCLSLLFTAQVPGAAHANGRMPGANDVIFDARDPDHLLLRATFGLVQTFDRGKSWQWVCEQVIDVSGVISDPPLGMTEDGTLVLLPPTGGALLSRDRGCSWARVGEPLAMQQGIDLTAHPSDARSLFVLLSTVAAVDAGFAIFDNRVLRTRDDAKGWELVATLPSDFAAETLEVAKSDPARIYVSGTDSQNPRLGVLYVSEDGGAHFVRRTLDLPAGSGSLLISAIHPSDPDRLWLRVPARGDTIGILPARLYLSTDKGQTYRMLAGTQRAMFGFALSPDGSTLAYGGPSDGLYVGASDGSQGFEKRGAQGIRCLRWQAGGLYACTSEPADAFSLGVSEDEGRSFRGLYTLRATCPAECAASSSFSASCQAAWTPIRPFIGADGAMCSVPWSAPADAGLDAAEPGPEPRDDAGMAEVSDADAADEPAPEPVVDAADTAPEPPAEPEPSGSSGGCSCRLAANSTTHDQAIAAYLALAALGAWNGRRWRRSRRGGA